MKINNFADNLHHKLGRWQLPESMFDMMVNRLQKCVDKESILLYWQHSSNTTKKCSSNKTGLDHIAHAALDALHEQSGNHVTLNRFLIFWLQMFLATIFSQPNPCHYFLWWFWKTKRTETTPAQKE